MAQAAAQAEQFVIHSEKYPNTIQVQFRVRRHVEFGQSVGMLGGDASLGSWDSKKIVPLTWSDGDHWHTTVDIPGNTYLEYKFVIFHESLVCEWEGGANHRLTLPKFSTSTIKVFDSWGGGN